MAIYNYISDKVLTRGGIAIPSEKLGGLDKRSLDHAVKGGIIAELKTKKDVREDSISDGASGG